MSENKKIDLETLSAALDCDPELNALRTVISNLQEIAQEGNEFIKDSSDPINSVNVVLDILREVIPELDALADAVNNGWWSYVLARTATMDEAFGYSRPKNWRQASEKFRINNISEIRQEVERLNEQGMSIEDAFAEVGEKYSKSSGLIKKLYYDLLRRKRDDLGRITPVDN